jgi:hypothetical protein
MGTDPIFLIWRHGPFRSLQEAAGARRPGRGGDLAAFLGEPEEITEIYLVRDASGGFRLGAGNDLDFPELRSPEFKAALAKLTASVKEFQVYENRDGVSLFVAPTATPETVAQDLETARAVLGAVEKK